MPRCKTYTTANFRALHKSSAMLKFRIENKLRLYTAWEGSVYNPPQKILRKRKVELAKLKKALDLILSTDYQAF